VCASHTVEHYYSAFRGRLWGRITPLSLYLFPRPHPSPPSALSFLPSGFSFGLRPPSPPHPPTPASQTALLHQFRSVPAWRGVRERREKRGFGEPKRQTGERDHGCSLCLAEDPGNTAGRVPGCGPSGEWTGEAETCASQAELTPFILRVRWGFWAAGNGQRGLDVLRWFYKLCCASVLVEVIKMLRIEPTQVYVWQSPGFLVCT